MLASNTFSPSILELLRDDLPTQNKLVESMLWQKKNSMHAMHTFLKHKNLIILNFDFTE